MNISSKELKKITRNQLSGKYGTFIGINVLYILITLVASNLMDLVLGTSSVLNPLTATSATVETLGISHTVVYYLSTFILSLILSVLDIGLLKIALDTARGYDIRFQDLFFGFKHHPDRAILAQGVILHSDLPVYPPGKRTLHLRLPPEVRNSPPCRHRRPVRGTRDLPDPLPDVQPDHVLPDRLHRHQSHTGTQRKCADHERKEGKTLLSTAQLHRNLPAGRDRMRDRTFVGDPLYAGYDGKLLPEDHWGDMITLLQNKGITCERISFML